MGIVDDLLGGIKDIGGSLLKSVIKDPMPLLQTGLTTISALSKDDSNYGTSKEYLDSQTAFEREKLAQALDIAKIQAASGGSGASAAIAVARINAAAQMQQLKEKLLADNLASKLQAVRGRPELVQNASQQLSQAMQNRGQMAQQGYQNTASLAQGFRAQ